MKNTDARQLVKIESYQVTNNNSLILNLERQLDSFNPAVRISALQELLLLVQKKIIKPLIIQESVNNHCHSFFSYNAYGYSPTHIAWLALKNGYRFMGIIDFDVLDGVDEFLNACELAGIRGSAGMETRVYIPEFSEMEINSPGEPGIAYHMGIGFSTSQTSGHANIELMDIRQRATHRNMEIVNRLNEFLAPLFIDYEKDVLPFTPAGYATERHIVITLINKAHQMISDDISFWSEKLNQPIDKTLEGMKDEPAFQNLVRSKLMKRGGPGYIQPTPESYPGIDEFNSAVAECGALPCAAWLDGTSSGEKRIEELLGLLIEKGVVALNIIPDRNWNISDPQIKKTKVSNLYHIVTIAEQMHMPIQIGTEMNSFGQKLIDDLDIPELVPLKDIFLKGAYFIYGHVRMQAILGKGFQSQWAKNYLPSRQERNDFFSTIGRLIEPDSSGRIALDAVNINASPQEILEQLKTNPGKKGIK